MHQQLYEDTLQQLADRAAAQCMAIGLHQERKIYSDANFAAVIFRKGIL